MEVLPRLLHQGAQQTSADESDQVFNVFHGNTLNSIGSRTFEPVYMIQKYKLKKKSLILGILRSFMLENCYAIFKKKYRL